MYLLKSGFWWPFSPISGHEQANSRIFCCFLEKNILVALRIPVCDWIVPELQSGELWIQQNLKWKIKPAKLTAKMHLIDLWTPVLRHKTLFLVQIHSTSLKFVPTVNFQPNGNKMFHMNNSWENHLKTTSLYSGDMFLCFLVLSLDGSRQL